MSLAAAADAVGGRLDVVPDPAAPVLSVTIDSRQARDGALFVALPGERVDGHAFAAGAVADGAVAVLAARPVGVPAIVVADPLAALGALAAAVRARTPATVVGVTGSSGKTSTKDLLAAVLPALGPTVASPGNFNNEIGLPLTVLRASADTGYLVLEMGARGPGHIARLCQIARPHLGLVLNVGTAHVGEYAEGRAGVARAKGELAEAASDLVVLNADDPLVAAMAGRAHARVVTFGTGPEADVLAADVGLDSRGRAGFSLHARDEAHPVLLRLVGEHQVANALAAAAVALELGMPPADAAAALSAAEPGSRWRMEVGDTPHGVTVVNDAYNANPDSMVAALRALAAMSRGRRSWAVLGEMAELGASAEAEHEALGHVVAGLGVDRLVTVGSGAGGIRAGAVSEGSWRGEAMAVDDVDGAVELLGEALRPGDVVLVKASRSAGLERVAGALLAGSEATHGAGRKDAGDAPRPPRQGRA